MYAGAKQMHQCRRAATYVKKIAFFVRREDVDKSSDLFEPKMGLGIAKVFLDPKIAIVKLVTY
jgi:hypothetical protein